MGEKEQREMIKQERIKFAREALLDALKQAQAAEKRLYDAMTEKG